MVLVVTLVKTLSTGYDLRTYLSEHAKAWMRLTVNRRSCFLANLESEIREFHDLQTHWNLTRSFTGSLQMIFGMRSKGRVGSDTVVRFLTIVSSISD